MDVLIVVRAPLDLHAGKCDVAELRVDDRNTAALVAGNVPDLALMPASGKAITKLDLPYVKAYRDRTKVWRMYFRRGGKIYGPLPGPIGSEEFMEAYQSFLSAKPTVSARSAPGTFGHLVSDYYGSVEFAHLKPKSRHLYKLILEPLVEKKGQKKLSLLTQDAATTMISDIGKTRPGLANLTRGVLNRVFRIAVDSGKWHHNRFARLTAYKIGTRHTWSEAELLAYEKRWPIGSRERLAYALLLYTGQRGGDVVRMRRQDIIAGEIHVVQEKTGAELKIPVHPELTKAMRAYKTPGMMLIGDAHGRPIKRNVLTTLEGRRPRCAMQGARSAQGWHDAWPKAARAPSSCPLCPTTRR